MDAGIVQPEHALEQACEHGPVVGQDRIVAVLKKRRLLDLDLSAEHAAAIDAAAHHPVDAAVAVIGAAIPVLAEGAPELRNHHDHRIPPSRRADLLGKSRERAPELAEAVGQITGGRSLIDVGAPPADIDKAEIELLAHQPADTSRRQLEAAR